MPVACLSRGDSLPLWSLMGTSRYGWNSTYGCFFSESSLGQPLMDGIADFAGATSGTAMLRQVCGHRLEQFPAGKRQLRVLSAQPRSEERRVGKEGRSPGSSYA